jgi:hypothetical protein
LRKSGFPKGTRLWRYVEECHKAIHRAQEARKAALRAQGEPDAYGIAKQSYEAFARDGLVFVGWRIEFLRDYIDYRSRGITAQKAEQLVLAKRCRKPLEKKSLAEERKSST